jgi:hypothetical protein
VDSYLSCINISKVDQQLKKLLQNKRLKMSQQLLNQEVEKLASQTKESIQNVQKIALSEAWKILQLTTAIVVQRIENIASDLAGKDKKQLALNSINGFYDAVFVVIDIPFVPNVFEPIIHRYVKSVLMIMVGSSIDATVTIFKSVGIFKKKEETS